MSLLFNMLSRLVITFLPRSKCLLISWLQSPSAVILEPKKINSDTVPTVSPSICHEVMGPDAMMLVFWMLSFKPAFSLSSFTFIKRLFSSSSLSTIRVVSSPYQSLLIFLPAILIPACASSSPAFKHKGPHKNYLFKFKFMFTLIKDVKVSQSCLTLWDPLEYTVNGILQARILEWVAYPFPNRSPWPGIELGSPALKADSLSTELSGKSMI